MAGGVMTSVSRSQCLYCIHTWALVSHYTQKPFHTSLLTAHTIQIQVATFQSCSHLSQAIVNQGIPYTHTQITILENSDVCYSQVFMASYLNTSVISEEKCSIACSNYCRIAAQQQNAEQVAIYW